MHLPYTDETNLGFTSSKTIWRIARYTFIAFLVLSWLTLVFHQYGNAPNTTFTSSTSANHLKILADDIAARTTDQFATFDRSNTCRGFSSLDLHKPSLALCNRTDTTSLLTALSSGGRIGLDAPYQPRGCDMRWYSTAETCEILARFSRITIAGDSLMREIVIALHLLLRQDFVHGASLPWFGQPEGASCECEAAWSHGHACFLYLNLDTEQLLPDHAEVLACPVKDLPRIHYNLLLTHPNDPGLLQGYRNNIFTMKPAKPHAIILGTGLWSNVNISKSQAWVTEVLNATMATAPWMLESGLRPGVDTRLFVTPSAAHEGKAEEYLASQGNVALAGFERTMVEWVGRVHGLRSLRTMNMSLQSSSYDGTHAGMRLSLLKAMAVLNWLDSLAVAEW